MKQVQIALMGMGRIGKIHFQNIQQNFSKARIAAVADPMLNESEFKQENAGIFFSPNPVDIFELPDIDAVLICTPTSSHAALIEMAIRNGKHVFCEKPMDLSLERTLELSDLAKDSGLKLMLGFNRRYDPDFLLAKQSVDAGRIGEVQIVKITSRDPGLPPIDYISNSGGLFMDMAIHDFDMARYIMQKKVVEVFAKGMVVIDKAVQDAGDIDTALTTLIFEDGTYAVIDNSRKAIYGYDQRIEIFGSKGMIKVENNLHHQNIIYDADGIHKALPLDFFMDRYAKSYLKEMEMFIDSLVHGKSVPSGAEDGLQATLIAFAANRSLQSGQPVKVEEISAEVKLQHL